MDILRRAIWRLVSKKIMIMSCGFGLLFFICIMGANMSQNGARRDMAKLATAYEEAYFARYPEYGLLWGRGNTALDYFSDNSLSALREWEQAEDDFLMKLLSLNESDLVGTPEHITYQLLKETLNSNKAARICKEELWNVNPMSGWHIMLGIIAEKQPVESSAQREQALKRWRIVKDVFKTEITNLKAGIKEGYVAPKPAVIRVLAQLNIILNTPIAEHPYFDFAKRSQDPLFKNQMERLIQEEINPALQHYAQFLQTEYLPHARDEIGVSALERGEACYRAKIRKETTLDISPQAIHEYGLAQMDQILLKVAEIGENEYGLQEMSAVFKRAKNDPQSFFQSEAEILNYNQNALMRAKAKAEAWFDMMPKADGILKPYPLHLAKMGASGEYHPPSDDGAQPGIFYINTYEPAKHSRIDMEATLFHELIPGHHFQVALAHEDKTHHSLDKYLCNAGYAEGWALYVESLSDEMNLYSDNISRLGMLSNEALRVARLVIDPGIHVMGWSREQAIDYLRKHTAMNESYIESEVDRYIMLPGQATSYMLGKREIENLREKAKKTLGHEFDIKQFHNQVLINGAVTLPMLRVQIETWLSQSKASA